MRGRVGLPGRSRRLAGHRVRTQGAGHRVADVLRAWIRLVSGMAGLWSGRLDRRLLLGGRLNRRRMVLVLLRQNAAGKACDRGSDEER